MTGAKPTRRVLDRALYALFSRHADRDRHTWTRNRYRGADMNVSFETFLSRVYGVSWIVFAATFAWAFVVGVLLPDATVAAVGSFVHAGVPVIDRVNLPVIPRPVAAWALAGAIATAAKTGTIRLGDAYLGWVANVRRANIERTLPGAVRYLRVIATGVASQRDLIRKVARNRDAYGETAAEFGNALHRAELTGSLTEGVSIVARDTPAQSTLAPFLMKFNEHASQGPDALAAYLRMESRMQSLRQDRTRKQAESFLELTAELFVVLLVLPTLLVIVVTVMSVLAPGLSASVVVGGVETTVRGLIVYGSAGFVLAVGGATALVVDDLRPPDLAAPQYMRPTGALAVLRDAPKNPASATVVAAPVAVALVIGLWLLAYHPVNVALLGYVVFAVPVGVVSIRRANLDDAKDRELRDFVHAISGHVSLGRPFPKAVERVAKDIDLGPLQSHVDSLAFTSGLTTHEGDLRAAALDRFVEGVGTPLAESTIGLVTGALDAGSDAETVFETLQTEVGRLHHQRKALRSTMLVYVAVGWTTALLVIGIVVAVNLEVLDGFAQLGAVSGSAAGIAIDPDAVDPARDRFRFYVVTQATMLACGWFAGMASRGRYEALLHSGALVAIAYFVFAGAGLV